MGARPNGAADVAGAFDLRRMAGAGYTSQATERRAFTEDQMRVSALAFVAACALAACNPSAPAGDAGSADAGGGLFPDLSRTAYRAEATAMHEGETTPIVMIRDGAKMRMEIASSDGQTIIIANGQNGENYIISTQGGRQMALRATGLGDQVSDPTREWQGELAETATRTGTCSVAGENGAEWTKTTEEGVETVCVTDDGIILRATDDGVTVWETTQVQRGAQEANLFELPPGVQVMDLGNLGAAAAAAMEQAKNADQ